MADVEAWNLRDFGELPNNTVVCKAGNVNQELVESLRQTLSVQSKLLSRNSLWHEMNTLKSVLYKHSNQQRNGKSFRGAKLLHKHLTRLKEMDLEKMMISFMNSLPKKNTPISIITRYPCYEAVEYVLYRLMGASKLAVQAINHCKLTFMHVHSQLALGYFVTYHLVIAAAASRVWVLLKDQIQNFIDCYKEVFPWLDIVRQTSSKENKDISPCLKTWLNFDMDEHPPTVAINNNNKSSSLLDKMFTTTPIPGKLESGSAFEQSEDILLEECLDSTKNEVEDSVIVPRNMFHEQAEFTNISQHNPWKRKSMELENAPECKKLFLDKDEKKHRKNKGNSVQSDDKTLKMKSSNNTSEPNILFNNENEDSNNNKKKRKLDYFAQNVNEIEVDSEEAAKKRKKKKKKKENNGEVVLFNNENEDSNKHKKKLKFDHFAQNVNELEVDSEEATNKRKKKKKKENKDEVELLQTSAEDNPKKKIKTKKNREVEIQQKTVSIDESSTSEMNLKKKKKKKKKQDSAGISSIFDDSVIISESNDDQATNKHKKSKKKKKEKVETEERQSETLNLVVEVNSESCKMDQKKSNRKAKKEKKKEKLGKNENTSNLEYGLLDETIDYRHSDELPKKKAKKHKNEKEKPTPTKNGLHSELTKKKKKKKKNKDEVNDSAKSDPSVSKTSSDKDYFDNLFTALGV